MLSIEPIRAFSDNYIWLLHDGKFAWVVDPGEAAPVLATLQQRQLQLVGILVTHHHFDHTGGIADLRAAYPELQIPGPASAHFTATTRTVSAGDEVDVLGQSFTVMEIPGHTLDHIAYFAVPVDGPPRLFCGDTLFAGGCGRVFEGTPAMMHQSLSRLANLPATTQFYCAHEYTLSNLKFACAVEPGNTALLARLQRDTQRRQQDLPTVPGTLSEELDTNPFLRCTEAAVIAAAQARKSSASRDTVAVFAEIRDWKNNF